MKNNLFEEFKISVSLLTWFTLRLEAHTWASIPPPSGEVKTKIFRGRAPPPGTSKNVSTSGNISVISIPPCALYYLLSYDCCPQANLNYYYLGFLYTSLFTYVNIIHIYRVKINH